MGTNVPRSLDVEQLARERAERVLGGQLALRYTPPLPLRWPPGPDAELVVFAYTSRRAKTGMIVSDVWSPRVAVTIALQKGQLAAATAEPLQETRLPSHQPRSPDPLKPERLRGGIDALLRVVAAPTPDRNDLEQVREVYRQWMVENSVLAHHIRQKVRSFLDWLEEP